jgi:protoporphyrinogen oxidase
LRGFIPPEFSGGTGQLQRTDILVVGAGPAGLTTAYMLAKAGRDVTVIERDPIYVGGISRTVNYKGFLFDIGGHRFFSKSKEVVALWDEILPDDLIERPRLSRIFYRGKFYSYPLKAFEALRNLGLLQSVACMASFAWPKPSPSKIPKPFTIGCATSSVSGCSRSSSRPTPKRCGGWAAMKFPPIGRRSASKG